MSIHLYEWGYWLEWVDTGHWTEGPRGLSRVQCWYMHVDRIAAHVDQIAVAYILLFLAVHLNPLFTMPPTVRTALASRVRRAYLFSPREMDILRAAKKEIAGAPRSLRAGIISKAIQDVVMVAQEIHAIFSKSQEQKLRIATQIWFRKHAGKRTKVEKVGTKAWTDRRVYFDLNRQAIMEKAQEIGTRLGKPSFSCLQKALSSVLEELPEEERTQLRLTAAEWNSSGPPIATKRK